MAIPRGYVGLVWDRSSLGVKGIHRFAGVIDSGYRGEVKVCLHNSNLPSRSEPEKNTYVVEKNDRIAQLIIQRVENFYVNQVKTLNETDRGEGGFGSSGK
jgi:dUTP pyrophosphatase